MAARSDDEHEELITPPVVTPFMPSLDVSFKEEEEPQQQQQDGEDILGSGFDVEVFTKRHLNCPKCGQYYNDPRTLPCLCSYCKDCLEETVRQYRAEKLAQLLQEEEEELSGEHPARREHHEEEGLESDDEYLESLCNNFNVTPCSSVIEEENVPPLQEKNNIDLDNFYCPQGCQATTGVKIDEEGQIYHLPDINLFLKNIIDEVRLKEELPHGRMLCQNCDIDDAVAIAICNDQKCANIPLCLECLTAHERAKNTKDHEIIDPIKGGHCHSDDSRSDGHHSNSSHGNKSGGSDGGDPRGKELTDKWKSFGRHSWHCHKHPRELVEKYCYNCKETHCMKCQLDTDGHWNCEIIKETKNCVEEEEEKLKELLRNVDELHCKIKRGIQNIEKLKVALIQDKDWILNEINDRCTDIVNSIEQQRIDLNNRTKETCNLKLKQLNESQDRLKRISETFTRSTKFIRDSTQMAIPTEFMFLKEGFHERLNYLNTHYADCHNDIPNDLNNRIYFKLNDSFNIENAIGQVRGTPFVRAFTIERFPQQVRARNCYPFEIKCRDICRVPLLGVSLPPLKATIERLNEEPIECFVKPDIERGTYAVYMYPASPGPYKVSVFNVQQHPFEDAFVRGFPVTFDVQP